MTAEVKEIKKKLWAAADKLRNNMDAAEYKHVIFGLMFLKYISDAFERLYERLKNDELADQKDSDESLAENVFLFHRQPVGDICSTNGQNYLPLAKTLTMPWKLLRKKTPTLKGCCRKTMPSLPWIKSGLVSWLALFVILDFIPRKSRF